MKQKSVSGVDLREKSDPMCNLAMESEETSALQAQVDAISLAHTERNSQCALRGLWSWEHLEPSTCDTTDCISPSSGPSPQGVYCGPWICE